MAKDRTRRLLGAALAKRLKANGFSKSGDLLFLRPVDSVTHLVEVQWSRWNDAHRVRFTINLGVHVPGVTSAFRRKPEPRKPKLTDCCVTARIGMLTESKLDIWWELADADPEDSVVEAGKSITAIVDRVAIPFFERFKSPDQVALFLSRDPGELIDPRAPALRLAYAALIVAHQAELATALNLMGQARERASGTPLEHVVSAVADFWEPRWKDSQPDST